MGEYNELDIKVRIEQLAYKLRHRRFEGFVDNSLVSECLVNEIKYLFKKLSKKSQIEILDKPWLDE